MGLNDVGLNEDVCPHLSPAYGVPLRLFADEGLDRDWRVCASRLRPCPSYLRDTAGQLRCTTAWHHRKKSLHAEKLDAPPLAMASTSKGASSTTRSRCKVCRTILRLRSRSSLVLGWKLSLCRGTLAPGHIASSICRCAMPSLTSVIWP